ncbi:hypothetical protein BDZ91DRAFT_732542 [Kalaharituber pfeilii]|nr:hypothetical protein BDZ91DRAFT_732542 [Kalaharituber pfeilii]
METEWFGWFILLCNFHGICWLFIGLLYATLLSLQVDARDWFYHGYYDMETGTEMEMELKMEHGKTYFCITWHNSIFFLYRMKIKTTFFDLHLSPQWNISLFSISNKFVC